MDPRVVTAVRELVARGRKGFRAPAVARAAGVDDEVARRDLVALVTVGDLAMRYELLSPSTGETIKTFRQDEAIPATWTDDAGEDPGADDEFEVTPSLVWVTFEATPSLLEQLEGDRSNSDRKPEAAAGTEAGEASTRETTDPKRKGPHRMAVGPATLRSTFRRRWTSGGTRTAST